MPIYALSPGGRDAAAVALCMGNGVNDPTHMSGRMWPCRARPRAHSKLVDRAPSVEAWSRALNAARDSGPGAPAAPADDRLRLLPSGPDLVHGPTSRGTRAIDATNGAADPVADAPREGVQPR